MASNNTTKQEEEVIDLNDLLHGAASLTADGALALPSVLQDDHEEFVSAQRIVDCRCELGECILYDDLRHAVLWTDIYGKKFHKLQLDYSATKKGNNKIVHSTYALPKMLCSFGLLEDDKEQDDNDSSSSLPLLCAWEDGFQIYDVVTGTELSAVSEGEIVNPNKGKSRLNDGRTDPTGRRFVCGGYYGGELTNKEKVFMVEQKQQNDGTMQLHHEPIIDEIQVTNSICWTLDGSRMYLADSITKQICSYSYNDNTTTGKLVLDDKQKFHDQQQHDNSSISGTGTTTTTTTTTVPDGSVVDEQGYVWNAVWDLDETKRGKVVRIDPNTGCVVYTVHVPDMVSQVSCCCFGGENMDILFITTACEGRDKSTQPHAGACYAAKVPFKGKKESRLKFTYNKKNTKKNNGGSNNGSSSLKRNEAGEEDNHNNSKKPRTT